jgi:hypothetical protein
MPLYPGAQAKKDEGDEKSRAHVKLEVPFLNFKIVSLRFTSDDATEKILAFYRDKLGSYGTVLECRGGGQDVKVESGRGIDSPVTCSKWRGNTDEITLKVGTEGNQHVVKVKPLDKGSEFRLVYVQMGHKNSGDDYGGRQPS